MLIFLLMFKSNDHTSVIDEVIRINPRLKSDVPARFSRHSRFHLTADGSQRAGEGISKTLDVPWNTPEAVLNYQVEKTGPHTDIIKNRRSLGNVQKDKTLQHIATYQKVYQDT